MQKDEYDKKYMDSIKRRKKKNNKSEMSFKEMMRLDLDDLQDDPNRSEIK